MIPDTNYAFSSLMGDTIDSKILSSRLLYLQFNGFRETKESLISYTRLASTDSFFYCLTGLQKDIYHSRLGICGQDYFSLYFEKLHPALESLLDKQGFWGTPYLIPDDSKQIGIIFQPKEHCGCSPLSLARQADQLIQKAYQQNFSQNMGRYCNTTALSEPVSGIEGVAQGYRQAAALKQLSFFHMAPGVLTREALASMQNQVDYRIAMSLCRQICQAFSHEEHEKGLRQTRKLFLEILKYSFSFELARNALSYFRQYLDIRLTIYEQLEGIDLDQLCRLDSYTAIEECLEALLPVLRRLSLPGRKLTGLSDLTAYSAYYIRTHLSEDISLNDIAAYVDAAPSHLSHTFHQQTGMTVKQYQTLARIEAAARLLTGSERKISEIAALTGFADRRYFTSLFKSAKGMTPQQYRQQYSEQVKNTDTPKT